MLLCSTVASSSTRNATVSGGSFQNTTSAADSTSSSVDATPTGAQNDVSSTSTHGVGDFVAFGVGMSASSGTSSSTFGETSSNTTSIIETKSSHAIEDLNSSLSSEQDDESVTSSTHPSGNLPHVSTVLTNATKSMTAVQLKPTNATPNETGFFPDNPNAIPPNPPILHNQSFTLSGDCWNQWSQFWSASSLVTQFDYYTHDYTTTFTTTESSKWMSTSTFLSFYTTTVRNGQFTVATYTTLAPVTDFEWFGTPTTTWTTTETTHDLTGLSVMPNASLPQPSCALPTLVPQCQSSWDRYISHKTAPEDLPFDIGGPTGCDAFATTMIPMSCKEPVSSWASVRSSYFSNEPRLPDCFQAKVPDDYCSSTRAQYIHKLEGKAKQSDGVPVMGWTETTMNGTTTQVPMWQPDTTIGGPGCTLGCGSCAMQGGTVELIYWPPATAAANMSTHGPVVATALGTTFTSPTVRFASPPVRRIGLTSASRFIYPSICSTRETAAVDSAPQSQTPSWPSQKPTTSLRSGAMAGPMGSNTRPRSTSQTCTTTLCRAQYTTGNRGAQRPRLGPKAVAIAPYHPIMLDAHARRPMSLSS